MVKATRFVLAIIFFLASLPAWAGSLSLVGGGSWDRSQISDVPAGSKVQGAGAQLGYGGGMLLNFELDQSPFSLEVGGLYVHQKQAIGSGFMLMNQVQVPADIRLWLGRVFSLGAGGYYARGIGNLEKADSSGNVTYNGPYSGIRTLEDYGALGSVRFQIPIGLSTNFLANANYLYGMKNINDTGDGSALKTREIQGFVGISFDW